MPTQDDDTVQRLEPVAMDAAPDDRLDEALAESFPASDPIALRVD